MEAIFSAMDRWRERHGTYMCIIIFSDLSGYFIEGLGPESINRHIQFENVLKESNNIINKINNN